MFLDGSLGVGGWVSGCCWIYLNGSLGVAGWLAGRTCSEACYAVRKCFSKGQLAVDLYQRMLLLGLASTVPLAAPHSTTREPRNQHIPKALPVHCLVNIN